MKMYLGHNEGRYPSYGGRVGDRRQDTSHRRGRRRRTNRKGLDRLKYKRQENKIRIDTQVSYLDIKNHPFRS